MPPSALQAHFLSHMADHSSHVPVYTDGSKSPRGAGFAVLFPDRSYQSSLLPEASILTAELGALLKAVECISSHRSSSFVIFSDSLSSLRLLQSRSRPHPLVLQILEWLFRLSVKKKSVQFCWVPSHIGIVGNEKVDVLARSAAVMPPSSSSSLPASDYFPVFNQLLRSQWQLDWSSSRFDSNKLRAVKPLIDPWAFPFHRNRRWESALARLRIGHTRLTHGFLMSRDLPPTCPHCRSRLTVSHILLTCPRLAGLRLHFFPFLSSLGRCPTLSDLLAESKHFNVQCLMSFLDHIHYLSDI